MRIVLILLITVLIAYAGAVSYFYLELSGKNKQLSILLDDLKKFRAQLEDEISRMDASVRSAQKENEQLKKESLDYLKREKETTEKCNEVETLSKEQTKKIKELQQQIKAAVKLEKDLKLQNEKLADINDLAGNVLVIKEKSKMVKLESELSDIRQRLSKQEALLHYNLGVSLTKEKSYEMAIDEYERALKLDPKDADSHYNLAIIYDEYRKNPKRAIEHYKQYLQLRPEAADIDEVKDWISRLEGNV